MRSVFSEPYKNIYVYCSKRLIELSEIGAILVISGRERGRNAMDGSLSPRAREFGEDEIISHIERRTLKRSAALLSPVRISRRSFLKSAVVLTPAVIATACGLKPPGSLSFYPADDPRLYVEEGGRKLVIEFVGYRSEILTGWFGDARATVKESGRRKEGRIEGLTLPGLGLEGELRLYLYQEFGRWFFSLQIAGLNFGDDHDLLFWMQRQARASALLPTHARTRLTKALGGFGLSIPFSDRIDVSIDVDWQIEVKAESEAQIALIFEAYGQSVKASRASLRFIRRSAFYEEQEGAETACASAAPDHRFGVRIQARAISGRAPALSLPLARPADRIEIPTPHGVDMDVFLETEAAGARRATVLIEEVGPVDFAVRPHPPWLSGLPAAAWSWVVARRVTADASVNSCAMFMADLAHSPGAARLGDLALYISRASERPRGSFFARYEADETRAAEQRFQVALNAVDLPMEGATEARLHLRPPSLDVAGLEPGDAPPRLLEIAPSPTSDAPQNTLYPGPDLHGRARLNGEGTALVLKRADDMLDLTVGFVAADILLDEQGASAGAASDGAALAFHLPPQHIVERAFFHQSRPDKGDALELQVDVDKTRLAPDDAAAHAAAQEKRDRDIAEGRNAGDLSEAELEKLQKTLACKPRKKTLDCKGAVVSRAAAPTRVVFHFPGDSVTPLRLDAASLSAWDGWSPKVAERAKAEWRDLETALRGVQVESSMSRADLLKTIVGSVRRPKACETALGLHYRMEFSPAETARWRTRHGMPAEAGSGGEAQMRGVWDARLDERGAPGLRALWSPDFEPTAFASDDGCHPVHTHASPWRDGPESFRTSLDGRDRHELVSLTALYGLPALAPVDRSRRKDDGVATGHPLVARPANGYEALLRDEEGFYLTKPLRRAEVRVSGLGGYVRLDGDWLPPAPKTGDGPDWPALTVERFSLESVMRRDRRVEIVYKGFLYPLGVRASLVKITERAFVNFGVPKRPVAPLLQRMFIVIGNPVKSYPALGQPFAGRDWPVDRLEIVTTTTPDIIDPADDDGGRIPVEGLRGRAFWPRVEPRAGGEVVFEYRLEGDELPARGKLLFVDNTAAHWPGDLKEIQSYYNGLEIAQAGAKLNRLDLRGQRRRYAPYTSPGDTEFETAHWILRARARGDVPDNPGNGDARYRMDAALEGIDQPPFYPYVHRAQINAQSVRALSGGGGSVTVAFADIYRNVGFESNRRPGAGGDTPSATYPEGNPSEIYLEVKRRPPAMDFSGDGTNSGGLVKPNLSVVAFSRATGTVGGRSRPRPADQVISGQRRTVESEIDIDIDQALQGVFDASQFFGGAFADAKLLGLLKLSDIVKLAGYAAGAPKMVEELLYSLPADDELITGVQALLNAVKRPIDQIVGALDAQPRINWRRLYPRLDTRLSTMQAVLKRTEEALSDLRDAVETSPQRSLGACLTTPPDERNEACKGVRTHYQAFVRTTPALVSEGRALRDELRRLRDDPTPTVLSDALATLRTAVTAFLRAADTLGDDVIRDVNEWLNEAVKEQLAGVENQICARPLKGDPEADLSDREHAVNYAATYLYGKPIWFTYEVVDEAGETTKKIGCEARPFDQSGSPNMDALRDALLYDFVTEPVMAAAVELKALFEPERDRLKTLKRTFERLVRAAAAIENLDLAAEVRQRVRKALKDKCGTTLEPLVFTLTSIGDNDLGARLTSIRRKLDIVTALDPQQVYEALRGRDERAARRARKAVRDLQAETRTLSTRLRQAERDIETVRAKLIKGDLCGSLFATLRPADLDVDPDLLKEKAGAAALVTRLQNLKRTVIADLETLDTALSAAGAFIDDLNAERCKRKFDLLHPIEGEWDCYKINCKDLIEELKSLRKEAPKAAVRFCTARGGDQIAETAEAIADVVEEAEMQSHAVFKEVKRTANLMEKRAQAVAKELEAVGEESKAAVRASAMRAIRRYEAEVDRRLLGGLLFVEAVEERLVAEARARLASVIAPILSFTVALHEKALDAQEALSGTLSEHDSQTKEFLELFLSEEVLKALGDLASDATRKALKRDLNALEAARPEAEHGRFTILRREFDGRSLALVERLNEVASISDPFGEPSFADLLDLLGDDDVLASLEEALKEAVSAFVPTAVNLSYEWKTALRPFPVGDPIFEMDSRRSDEGADEDDLVIDAKGGVDLLTGAKSFSVRSTLSPYRINLFPGVDLATIRFKGARFVADQDGTDFSTKINKVELGEKLQYVAELAKLLAPNNGPYVRLVLAPVGIEAGYRLDVGTFILGPLAFSNIALEVGCELPLDNREATFRFGLSSRARPFLISSPPYGGGGSVSIRTRASTIVSLSTSFEFGAVTDLSYGPLKAQGRVTTGIHVDKSGARDVAVTGFFIAMGEGGIAFFHVSVCFSVALEQVGSSMRGDATYAFSFKAGFLKYRYSVGVSYQLSGSSGRSEQPALSDSGAAGQTTFTGAGAADRGQTATITTDFPSEEDAWSDYRALFA